VPADGRGGRAAEEWDVVGSDTSTGEVNQEDEPAAARSRPISTTHAVVFTGLLVLSLLPVLLVDMPAGVDVPNHVARMTLLTQALSGEESKYYEVRWALYPNLAMDLIVPLVAQVTGAVVATKAFYVLSQLLLVSGAVAIELAHKRRFHASGYAALAYLYSIPFAWGFMNFAFGLGLALWGVALFVVLQERRVLVRAAAHAAVVAVLFPAHFFALGLYGVTAGLIEVWLLHARRRGPGGLVVAAAWLAAPAAVVLALLVAVGGVGGQGTAWNLPVKVIWLLASVNGYSWDVSLVLGVLVLSLTLVLARARALRLEGPGRFLLVGFALLFLAMPARLLDTGSVDVRVVVAAFLIVPAFVRLRVVHAGVRGGLAVAGVALLLANLAVVTRAQVTYDGAYADMLASFGAVDPGSRVLVAAHGTAADPPSDLMGYPLYHAPTLAAAARDALVPTLFTQPGKQPLVVRQEFRDLDVDDYGVLPVELLARSDDGDLLPEFAARWEEDFDYVYVLGPPGPNPVPRALVPLLTSERFTLYSTSAGG
jgi:hypothetical protein